jgi:type I restriction enzyme S subunit
MKQETPNAPKLRFKNINNQIFSDWIEKRLTDVASNFNSSRKPISKDKRIKGKYPYYGANGIIDFVDNYILEGEYVLVAEDGVVDFKNYPIHLVNCKFWPNNHAHILNGNKVLTKFLYYLLKSYDFSKYITGSAQSKLNWGTLSNLIMVIPEIDEQKKISDFLETVDKYIENLKSQKEELEKFKKRIMQKIFSKKILINEVKENELGNICKISTGKLDANAMKENGKYRFYTCAKEYYFIDNYAFDTEALLISGNGANVGYIHYYNGKFNAYQRTYVLENFSENILFIKYFLEENLSKRINKEKKAGNTPYIVLDTLKKMKITLPNKIDQEKFVKLLLSIDKLIENKDQEIEFIETWKKGLMQQMFI